MGLFSIDDAQQTVQAGAPVSVSTIVTPTRADIAICCASGNNNGGSTVAGGAPDGTWTGIVNFFWKQINSIGPLAVAQPILSLYDTIQFVLLLKSDGHVPVFTLNSSGSGGVLLTANPLSPAKGNSLLWLVAYGNGDFLNGTTSIQNAAGINWNLLCTANRQSNDGGFPHDAFIDAWYAENLPAGLVNVQPSINVQNGGTWALVEISHVLTPPRGNFLAMGMG